MTSIPRTTLPWLLAVAAAFGWWQDPVAQEPAKDRPAPPPAGAPPLAPLAEPFVSPVPRLDLQLRATPRDPIEGFWQLRDRVVGGRSEGTRSKGWLAVGRAHLLLHLLAEGPDPGVPILRAGVRQWQRDRELIRMTALAGHLNDADGDIVLEKAGLVETRRFELLGSVLRIVQDNGDRLEFVRIE